MSSTWGHHDIHTNQEAESSTFVMVGTVGDRSGGTPQSLASVCILLLLFKQTQVLEKLNPLSNNQYVHLNQVILLHIEIMNIV